MVQDTSLNTKHLDLNEGDLVRRQICLDTVKLLEDRSIFRFQLADEIVELRHHLPVGVHDLR